MDSTLLIVGNSHINAFRRSFGQSLKTRAIQAQVHYVMTNLLETPWGDFNRNAHLRHLRYRDGLSDEVDLRKSRGPIDIVMVGMGLLGGGILLPFGGLKHIPKEDYDRRESYLPAVPRLTDMPANALPDNGIEPLTAAAAYDLYYSMYDRKFGKVKRLVREGRYRSLYWIAEPDMTEVSAVNRFGRAFVESGIYTRYREIARRAVGDLVSLYRYEQRILLHDDTHYLPSGFVEDSLKASIDPCDIHLLPSYFQPSVECVLERLTRQRNWLDRLLRR